MPPPFLHSIKVFEQDQVLHIIDYVVNSYYRHFRLYKYIFSVKILQTIEQVLPQQVELMTPSLPPLDGGLFIPTPAATAARES